MNSISFSVVGVRPEPYAAVPTLLFRLRICEGSGQPVDAVALRCQIRIEPRRRQYLTSEQEGLHDLFRENARWGPLQSLLWTQAYVMVPQFSESVEVDLPVACTYDFEVTAARYFEALRAGEIPLLFLFSGTIFGRDRNGFCVEPVPWEKEATYRLPLSAWRDLMDHYFPDSAWIRLRRENFEALTRFKSRNSLPTWDDTMQALLTMEGVGTEQPVVIGRRK